MRKDQIRIAAQVMRVLASAKNLALVSSNDIALVLLMAAAGMSVWEPGEEADEAIKRKLILTN